MAAQIGGQGAAGQPAGRANWPVRSCCACATAANSPRLRCGASAARGHCRPQASAVSNAGLPAAACPPTPQHGTQLRLHGSRPWSTPYRCPSTSSTCPPLRSALRSPSRRSPCGPPRVVGVSQHAVGSSVSSAAAISCQPGGTASAGTNPLAAGRSPDSAGTPGPGRPWCTVVDQCPAGSSDPGTPRPDTPRLPGRRTVGEVLQRAFPATGFTRTARHPVQGRPAPQRGVDAHQPASGCRPW